MAIKVNRNFNLVSIVALLVGSMIGTGIFIIPSFIATKVSSPLVILLSWGFAGLLTLSNALYLAELSNLMPEQGGLYIYFKRIFGDFTGFLFGWANFIILGTGFIAGIAFVFGSYFNILFPLPHFSEATIENTSIVVPIFGKFEPLQTFDIKLAAMIPLWLLTLINCASISLAKHIQIVTTAFKIVTLLILCAGLFNAPNAIKTQTQAFEAFNFDFITQLTIGIGTAMWAYTGWINVFSISGEIKRASLSIPKGVIIAVVTVIVIYLLINIMYLRTLSIEQMASSKIIAVEVTKLLYGNITGTIVAVVIIIFSVGSLNGNLLASSRISMAFAQDIKPLTWAGSIHPKFKTPYKALLINSIWISILIFFVPLNRLIIITVMISSIFAFLISIVSLKIRNIKSTKGKLFKAPLYPYIPILSLILSLLIFGALLFESIEKIYPDNSAQSGSVLGLIMLVAGIPFYLFRKK